MMLRHLPLLLIAVACDRSGSPEYLAAAPDSSAGPVIIFDLDARPLPEIPFPTDLATRLDPASPTGRYLNISEEGATRMEVELRQRANTLDGFGTYSPITVAFDAPVDLCSIANTHHGEDDFGNDAILLIDLNNGEAVNLDLNRGFFPYLLPGSGNSDAPHLPRPRYYADDQRASSSTLIFDDHPEDANGNGQLDPGEDSDQDGKLDGPAHQALPNCEKPWRYVENTIWETETNTLQIRPIRPLQPGHTYAMVLTNRLKDSQGAAVRSPFPGINHPRQTGALSTLPSHLSALGLSVGDIAFTWTFTTSTASEDLFAIREGMYGSGQFAWLDEKFPADWQSLHRMLDEDDPIFIGTMSVFIALAVVLMIYVWNTEPVDSVDLEAYQDRFIEMVLEAAEQTQEEEQVKVDVESDDAESEQVDEVEEEKEEVDRKPETEEEQEMANKYNIPFIETSAKENKNVQQALQLTIDSLTGINISTSLKLTATTEHGEKQFASMLEANNQLMQDNIAIIKK